MKKNLSLDIKVFYTKRGDSGPCSGAIGKSGTSGPRTVPPEQGGGAQLGKSPEGKDKGLFLCLNVLLFRCFND